MDSKYYLSGENAVCNECSIKQSLLKHSSRNKELSSASSISPSMSVSVVENSVVSQFSLFCPVNEVDRLISDQGLIIPKERPNTSRRKIRDKSYYKGLIHLKTKEIFNEIKKLQKEISLLSVDHCMYMSYKEKAEAKAMDLQNLQKTLAEYNLLDDMLRRDIQLGEAKEELQELKASNKRENRKVEKLFAMTEQIEKKVKEMEINLSQEDNVSEILMTNVTSPVFEKLKNLKRVGCKLEILRTEEEEELMDLKKKRINLEKQYSQGEVSSKILELLKKLWSSEEERNELHSRNKLASSLEKYECLQKYEAECSILLKGLMQEMQNIENKILITKEELKKMESESYNPYSDRFFKYSKLKEQEKIIDEFLSCYRNEQRELLAKRQQEECKIVELLEEIGKKYNSFDSDLKNENDKKICTAEDLKIARKKMEYEKATELLESVIELETRLIKEQDDLKNQIRTLEKKLLIVSHVDKAKEHSKGREKKFLNELNEVKKQKRVWKHIIKDLKERHDSLQDKLYNNETYMNLSKLEKRWHELEKENFVMKSLITSEEFEKEYLLLKSNVRKLYSKLNNML